MAAIVNTSDLEIRRAREELPLGLGLDAKRPTAWAQYGYPEQVTFAQLLTAYERGGAGHGAVHRILDKCWQALPRIKKPAADKPGPWEEKVGAVLKAARAWAKLVDFDRRNMVGRYSALIYRVADTKALSEPLERAQKLVDLIPVYEDQIKVTRWDSDQASETYGQPLMFQYRRRVMAGEDTLGRPDDWANVHRSRVQMLAEGSVGDSFDGVPLLGAGFNHLIDLEKVAGGSAESFLKNGAQTVVFEYDPKAQVQTIGEVNADGSTKSVRDIHGEPTRTLNGNQDASIVVQGGKANKLQTSLGDLAPSSEAAAALFPASVQIPSTILFDRRPAVQRVK